MIPVSVIIPVKNEEKNLPRCLVLLKRFDEVLLVDSGSTDSTLEIAKASGAKIIDFQWDGKFPKKRNWVLRNVHIRNDWVLFLDADEYVSEEFISEVGRAVEGGDADGFWITYQNYFMGRLLRYGDTMRKLALFRKSKGEYEKIEEDFWSHLDMEVHEHPMINGKVGALTTQVEHHDYKDFEAYIHRHNAYSSWEAKRYLILRDKGFDGLTERQKIKYMLMDTWLLGPLYFLVAYFLKFGFLDGKPGLLLALNKMGYYFQIKCKIGELRSHRA